MKKWHLTPSLVRASKIVKLNCSTAYGKMGTVERPEPISGDGWVLCSRSLATEACYWSDGSWGEWDYVGMFVYAGDIENYAFRRPIAKPVETPAPPPPDP